jgi:hypothetical protein
MNLIIMKKIASKPANSISEPDQMKSSNPISSSARNQTLRPLKLMPIKLESKTDSIAPKVTVIDGQN